MVDKSKGILTYCIRYTIIYDMFTVVRLRGRGGGGFVGNPFDLTGEEWLIAYSIVEAMDPSN